MRRAHIALMTSMLVLCCARAQEPLPSVDRQASVESYRAQSALDDRVVSTVDGTPITLGQVRDLARETGLSPLEALHRLQEERVLVTQAEAQGLGDAPEVREAVARASVRALLRARIEGPLTPESFSDQEVRERAQRDAARFTRNERRRSTHVLAEVAPDAPAELSLHAMAFVREAIERLAAAEDPISEAHAIASTHQDLPFRVRVEDLPPVEREGPLVSEYSSALFSRETTGVVGEPIRTRFGWHAIVVRDIHPAWQIPEDEVERVVRKELATEMRARALDSLVQELASRTNVEVDESAFRAPNAPGDAL